MIVTAQFSWRDRFGVMTGPQLDGRYATGTGDCQCLDHPGVA